MTESVFSTVTPVAPWGTTVERTLLAGPAGPGGFRMIEPGAGEPHLLRTELSGRPVVRAAPHRGARFGAHSGPVRPDRLQP